MWITENSVEVIQKIIEVKKGQAKNIRTYDFSTLYTSIPHRELKEKISWVISQCFDDHTAIGIIRFHTEDRCTTHAV